MCLGPLGSWQCTICPGISLGTIPLYEGGFESQVLFLFGSAGKEGPGFGSCGTGDGAVGWERWCHLQYNMGTSVVWHPGAWGAGPWERL